MLLKKNIFNQMISYRGRYNYLQSRRISNMILYSLLNGKYHGYIIEIHREKLVKLSYGLTIHHFSREKYYE